MSSVPKRQAAKIGRAAFFAPLMRTRPLRAGLFSTTIFSKNILPLLLLIY